MMKNQMVLSNCCPFPSKQANQRCLQTQTGFSVTNYCDHYYYTVTITITKTLLYLPHSVTSLQGFQVQLVCILLPARKIIQPIKKKKGGADFT